MRIREKLHRLLTAARRQWKLSCVLILLLMLQLALTAAWLTGEDLAEWNSFPVTMGNPYRFEDIPLSQSRYGKLKFRAQSRNGGLDIGLCWFATPSPPPTNIEIQIQPRQVAIDQEALDEFGINLDDMINPPRFYWSFSRSRCEIHTPFWLNSFVVSTALAIATSLFMWRLSRVTNGGEPRCPKCGYDLRVTPGRCPECAGGKNHKRESARDDEPRRSFFAPPS